MNLTVSIIIPVFNAEKTLERCLESVMHSIDSQDEVIVVDDASTDQSVKIARRFPVQLIHLNKNSGPSLARNTGAMAAQKKILLFVDSDVVIDPGHVEKIKKYLKENPEVHSLTLNVDSDKAGTDFFTDFKNLYMNYIISKSGTSVNYIYGNCCATRRNSFVRWPEYIRMTEDSLWGYQQKKLGLTINCLDEIQVKHLKNYNFLSLMKYDFQISYHFAHSFLGLSRWKTLYSREKFGHTSKKQKVSVMLAGGVLFSGIVAPVLTVPLLLTWIFINYEFFSFLKTTRSWLYSLASIAWYFLTNLVYLTGLVAGSLTYLSGKPRLIQRDMI